MQDVLLDAHAGELGLAAAQGEAAHELVRLGHDVEGDRDGACHEGDLMRAELGDDGSVFEHGGGSRNELWRCRGRGGQ